jgi:hypothetical protein
MKTFCKMLIQNQRSMSKFFVSIILLSIGLIVSATDRKDVKFFNLQTFRQIEVQAPWLQFGNGAGLSQMPELFLSEMKFDFGQTNGDFHSIFAGKSDQSFGFRSKSFQKINKTYLYGSFNYRKSYEDGLIFSNTNDPSLNYPYLLADTIGNDTYDREFFNLAGIISSPINSKFDWGLNFDYQVGVASQNRDPRPENKVMQANISPGFLFKHNKFKLGVNLSYGYYNEDIDVSVVQEGVQHSLFQLHGPGVFNYHVSSSFFRLYQQHKFGGGLQFEIRSGNTSNIVSAQYYYSVQTIDDGRKGSSAIWSAVKNDAQMDGVNWNLADVFSIDRGKKLHQLKTILHINNKLGTEFIQRLEKVGETDQEHWISYGKEQKYYSLQTNAALNYQLMTKDDNNLMKSLFCAGLGYSAFNEKYYLPNQELKYSNLMLESSFLKLFNLPKSSISAEVKLKYQFNLEGSQNLTVTNFMVQKIYAPEFNYLTKNFVSPGVSISYQLPLKKGLGKYFIKSDFDWCRSENGLNCSVLSYSAGIIF